MTPQHRITIDRSKPLAEDPGTGHNRWHPGVEPILHVREGEIIEIETRDAYDGQISAGAGTADLAGLVGGRTHPLTGPVAVDGAEPGDLLEMEILEVAPTERGFTILSPDFGVLRGYLEIPFLAQWWMDDGFAISPQIEGVRIPASAFMGTHGVAPSQQMLVDYTAYETALMEEFGAPAPTEPGTAFPDTAKNGLRTIPPRDNGGNIDVTQLTPGSRVRYPVFVEGGLFSTGDAHFSQGDNECCTAIEMGATLTCRFRVLKGVAARHGVREPQFVLPAHDAMKARPYFGTTGQSYSRDGSLICDDVTNAARNALVNIIEHLGVEYGYDREQSAVICSVAVDLKISQAANNPNYIVAAFLPTDIFTA
jgi:formamidase